MSQSPNLDPGQSLDQLLQFYQKYPFHTLSDEDRAEAHRLETLLQEKQNLEDQDQTKDIYISALKFNLYMVYAGLPRLKYAN